MRRYHRLSYTKLAIVPLRDCEPCGQFSMDSVLFGGNTIRCDSEITACASERSEFFSSFLSGLESFKSSYHHLWLGFIIDDCWRDDFVGKHFKTGCCGFWTFTSRLSGTVVVYGFVDKKSRDRMTNRAPKHIQFSAVTGAGQASRHFLPHICVVTTPAMKATASTIAWQPKLTPGPVVAIHFS
jgi:hypothetical protein